MLIVGLTGSVATGKTTVARMFAKKGAKRIDADRVARELMCPGEVCYSAVIKQFGAEILNGQCINRRKLAGIVFNDEVKLRVLESIVHKHVFRRVKKMLQEIKRQDSCEIVVLDVPLLFEAKWDKWVDVILVVKTIKIKQIERAAKSIKTTKADVSRRIKAQWPLKKKVRLADFIIDNNGNLNQTKKQVDVIWQKLQLKIKK